MWFISILWWYFLLWNLSFIFDFSMIDLLNILSTNRIFLSVNSVKISRRLVQKSFIFCNSFTSFLKWRSWGFDQWRSSWDMLLIISFHISWFLHFIWIIKFSSWFCNWKFLFFLLRIGFIRIWEILRFKRRRFRD